LFGTPLAIALVWLLAYMPTTIVDRDSGTSVSHHPKALLRALPVTLGSENPNDASKDERGHKEDN